MDAFRYDLDMEHQIHFGKKFYQDKKTGYWISTTSPRIRAHVWVWINHHGDIPKKHHVHHIDENKSNNDISNLQCLSATAHLSGHITEEKKEWAKKWVEVIRPMTKEWHASEEGRAWHREHGKKCMDKRPYINKNCNFCGKQYQSKMKFSQYCHQNCKMNARRRRLKLTEK